MAKSRCFREYDKCVTIHSKDWIDNLDCAAELTACIRRKIFGSANKATIAAMVKVAAATGTTAGLPRLRVPTAAALSKLPPDEADTVRDAVRLLNALNAISRLGDGEQ